VTVQSVTVRFDATNKTVKPGDQTTFTGVVLIDSSPGVSRSVSIQINVGGTWTEVARTTTNPYGAFSYTWTVPWTVGTTKLPCNSWSFRAVDVSSGQPSGTITITVYYPTDLTVSTDKSAYATGETVTVTVTLKYLDSDGLWKPLANQYVTVTAFGTTKTAGPTGSDGTAKVTFTAPSTTGTYTITASFAGTTAAAAAVAARTLAVQQAAGWLALAAPALAGAGILLLAWRR
jgi:hypothetical protein